MTEEFIKNAVLQNLDEVQPPFKELLAALGFEGIFHLCEISGGTNLYIPSLQRIFRGCLEKQIPKEFDGENYRELSKNYGLSERTIRNVVSSCPVK